MASAARTFHEYRRYSVIHDREMARLSVFDARGSEFFAYVPFEQSVARPWRERRAEVLDKVADAMDAGRDPGEVRVS